MIPRTFRSDVYPAAFNAPGPDWYLSFGEWPYYLEEGNIAGI